MTENQTIQSIQNRRSIRKYKQQPIEQNILETILDVATQAPSALNKQPCKMIVVRDQRLLEEIDNAFIEAIADTADRSIQKGYLFHGAPCVVMLPRDANNDYSQEDSGILAQTIALAADSVGLGSCIVGLIHYLKHHERAEEFFKTLSIPENYSLDLCVTLGYADEEPLAKPRKNNIIWQS